MRFSSDWLIISQLTVSCSNNIVQCGVWRHISATDSGTVCDTDLSPHTLMIKWGSSSDHCWFLLRLSSPLRYSSACQVVLSLSQLLLPATSADTVFAFDKRTKQVYEEQVGFRLHGSPGLKQRWRNWAGPPLRPEWRGFRPQQPAVPSLCWRSRCSSQLLSISRNRWKMWMKKKTVVKCATAWKSVGIKTTEGRNYWSHRQ